jgi:hypothetical protein
VRLYRAKSEVKLNVNNKKLELNVIEVVKFNCLFIILTVAAKMSSESTGSEILDQYRNISNKLKRWVLSCFVTRSY